jgi:hypothetical protein
LFLAAISMLNACFSVAALLMQDRLMRETRWRDLLRLVLVSPPFHSSEAAGEKASHRTTGWGG